MIFSYLLNMQSHPSWVCGLKHYLVVFLEIIIPSHPSWVCGLKQNEYKAMGFATVTPFVGVWIETASGSPTPPPSGVTPFVGVWIETFLFIHFIVQMRVTPFVGVWIETCLVSSVELSC